MDFGLVGAAFAAGLLSFFSPCLFPLLPVYVGLLTTDAGNENLGLIRRVANTVAFVLGISTTFLLLGLGAGTVGRVLSNSYVAIICGILIIFFGLYLAGVLKISFMDKEKRADLSKIKAGNIVGAFLLGVGFSFGWTPCIGPILGTVLAMAAQQGTAVAGAALTFVYSLGMCIPFVVITLASNLLLMRTRKLNKYMPIVQRIGGILICLVGAWMIFTSAQNIVASVSVQSDSASTETVQSESVSRDSSAEVDVWRHQELENLDGQTVTIADYEGKPVYLEFFGSWCPQCMENMGNFRKMAQKHNEAGDVQVIGVAFPGLYGEYDKEEFVKWCQVQGYEFPILMDETGELVEYFGVAGFPTSVFVDSKGTVQMVRAGVIEEEELEGLFAVLADM